MARHQVTRTRLDPGTRREQILVAASAVLSTRSAGELTFESVAEAAGVSRALVYNYFGDRNGLLAAVELRALEELNRSLHASIDTGLAPAEQIAPLARAYLSFADAHGPLWNHLAAGGVHHPSVEAARRIRIERLAELWGGTEVAHDAATAVTVVLESATIGGSVPGTDASPGAGAVATVCRILTSGLEAGLAEHPTPLR